MPDPLTGMDLAAAPSVAMVFERLAQRGDAELLWTPHGSVSAAATLARTRRLVQTLRERGVKPGAICAFDGDYGPHTVAAFLALFAMRAIAVPFAAGVGAERDLLASEAAVEWTIDPQAGTCIASGTRADRPNPLISALTASGKPGLIVFTSGSSGKPKAILHDVDRVASKFAQPRPGRRLLMFLLMDHFGGFNTLLSVLANDSVGICSRDRSPQAVCEAIAQGRADVLPTTPTFLGLLIASGLWEGADLSSVKLVTYGAEPMPQSTLRRMQEVMPWAEFKQTYGLSELGVLRSMSPDQSTLWLKIGGEGFETRITDGQLHIRSQSSMLGYLNAPSPIDAEGWMNTGDLVEERDGLIRFLGRRSEVINVGGQKVLPSEVEDVLLEADGVADVIVQGISHKLLGQAVVARVSLVRQEDPARLAQRLREHCRARLQKYKVPIRFDIVESDAIVTRRAKKNRASPEGT